MRLGHVKALEKINRQSLIERTINCLSLPTQAVLVVTSPEQFDIIAASGLRGKVIVDSYPGKGALGGIYTGLADADSFYSLVVGCDMPFLNRDLLRYLIELAPGFDAVVPAINDMYEPLHAVYSKGCLAPINELIVQNKLGISQLFNLVKIRYVGKDEIARFDPQFLSFFNVNTQDDLEKAKKLVEQSERCPAVQKDEFKL